MNTHALQKKILSWYALHKRDLPWRRTEDPYKILVSEIMLQQTQVDRVVPKYHAFLKKFPTCIALARGKRSDVLALWSGLGYNNRAVRLHELAQIVVSKHEGEIPKDYESLISLPGVGPYTAHAILSFAFNLPYACVDTNIRRILIHELTLPHTLSDVKLRELAQELIPKNKSREWHNALMDYGSAVLTSKKTGIKAKTQQSKFFGSRRWYRGQIMKLLVERRSLYLTTLSKKLQKEDSWIKNIVDEMAMEGLVLREKEKISLPT